MRGADSSLVRLFADSRYQLQSTFPGIRRAVSIDDFHDARVCPRLMAIIFGLGLEEAVRRTKLGPGCCSPVYGELLAQDQILKGELAVAAEEEGEEPK